MSDALDRRLRPDERVALRLHLLFCRACARVQRQLAFFSAALARSAERPPDGKRPSPDESSEPK